MRAIFEHARQHSPCILVLEDLDAMVTDDVRSFFLNELDGLVCPTILSSSVDHSSLLCRRKTMVS